MAENIIVNGVDVSWCDFLAKEDDYCSYSGEYRAYKGQCGCSDEEMCKNHPNCFYKKALKQLKRKEQECEELRQYHNKCCIEFKNEKQELLEKYNQVSRDFYNGKYCNKENCSLLKAKEQECETLVCQLDFEVQKKECLEQECEELNKQVNDLLNKPEIQDKILWKIDNKALLRSKDAWIYKLEQTLIEIKEIAEKQVKHAPDGETFTRPEIKQILQKISEVEND